MNIEFIPSRKSMLCYLFENNPMAGNELFDFSDAQIKILWQQTVAMLKVRNDVTSGFGFVRWTDTE